MIKPGPWSPTLSQTKGLKIRLMLILYFVICCYCTMLSNAAKYFTFNSIQFTHYNRFLDSIWFSAVCHMCSGQQAMYDNYYMMATIWLCNMDIFVFLCPCTTSSNWFQQTWAVGCSDARTDCTDTNF